MVVLGAVGLALTGWVYDAGRRIAGFDSTESAQEIGTLRAKVAELESEVAKLRAANNASESSLQIERAAQKQMAGQVGVLEAENNRLKEENAVLERLAQGEGKDSPINVSRLKVVLDGASGRYRYQFFVSQNGDQRGKEFKGTYQVVVASSDGGMISVPRAGDPDAGRYVIAFRHFRRIDGAFNVPGGMKLKSVEIRLSQDGAVKASQTIAL